MYDYELFMLCNQFILGPDHEQLNCRYSFVDELSLKIFLLCCCVLILYYPRDQSLEEGLETLVKSNHLIKNLFGSIKNILHYT